MQRTLLSAIVLIAPNGKLRSGSVAVRVVGGVAEPVGKFIAAKLGVSFESIMYPNPEAYAQSFGKGEWDIAIGPRVLAATDRADLGSLPRRDMRLRTPVKLIGPESRWELSTAVRRTGT
jgi:hypothetical protein